MQLPGDRKYVVSHEWAKDEDGVVLVGITDFAQDQLGDLVFVGDFTPGTRLAAGATAGVVESVKAASDIYAPVAGERNRLRHLRLYRLPRQDSHNRSTNQHG